MSRWPKDPRKTIQQRQTVTAAGDRMERTELLPRAKAELLYAALSQDPARFCGVELVRDHHVTTEARWLVRFVRRPVELSGLERRDADIRIERAMHQFPEMEFLPIEARQGWHLCVHFKTGQDAAVYETHTDQPCTCPDYAYRLNGRQVHCKHQQALRIELGLPAALDGLSEFARRHRAERRAQIGAMTPSERAEDRKRSIAMDFG